MGERSLIQRVWVWMDRYKARAYIVIAVLATVALVVSKLSPDFDSWMRSSQIIPYLTLLLLLDLAGTARSTSGESWLNTAVDQDTSLPQLIAAAGHCRGEDVQLLEYAGQTTLPLIREIARVGARLQILVKHPDTITGLQQQRMITTLDTLYNSVFENAPKERFELRCYRLPYSLRARRIGTRVLELGWLTPDPKRQSAFGHSNPSLLIDLSVDESQAYKDFFTKSFAELWDATDTEDGRLVLERYQSVTP